MKFRLLGSAMFAVALFGVIAFPFIYRSNTETVATIKIVGTEIVAGEDGVVRDYYLITADGEKLRDPTSMRIERRIRADELDNKARGELRRRWPNGTDGVKYKIRLYGWPVESWGWYRHVLDTEPVE